MATTVDEITTGTVAEINVGAAAAVGAINPLAGQLDVMAAVGLTPFQADLTASLDASLALQASLAISISDPFANIRAALAALAELQGSLTAALALPPIALSVSAELGASAALSAALSAKLGMIRLLLDAAIDVKIPAVRLAAELAASLSVGPVTLLAFDGISNGAPGSTLQEIGAQIASTFNAAVGSPAIQPTDVVSGIIILTSSSAAFEALGTLIPTP